MAISFVRVVGAPIIAALGNRKKQIIFSVKIKKYEQ